MEIGTEMGNVVARGLIQTYESADPSNKQVEDIHKEMQQKSVEITAPFQAISIIISLPLGPLTYTFWRHEAKRWIWAPALAREITREQVFFRAKAIGYLENGLNSITVGLLLYFMMWLYSHIRNRWKVLHIG